MLLYEILERYFFPKCQRIPLFDWRLFMEKMKRIMHKWSWTALVLFCLVGLFYPIIGIAALICMLSPVVVSFFKGRLWCGNFCPRGSFNDIVLGKISKKLHIPKFLKSKWVKYTFLGILMSMFAVQLTFAWGNLEAVGLVFVRMIIMTTLLAIVLGTVFNQRTWCTICPMGTMASLVSGTKAINSKIKHVTFEQDKCISCNLCSKSCVMNIDVLEYKSTGKVTNSDCLKCNVCVDKCPKKSLSIA